MGNKYSPKYKNTWSVGRIWNHPHHCECEVINYSVRSYRDISVVTIPLPLFT